jgi:hypothetical protein
VQNGTVSELIMIFELNRKFRVIFVYYTYKVEELKPLNKKNINGFIIA